MSASRPAQALHDRSQLVRDLTSDVRVLDLRLTVAVALLHIDSLRVHDSAQSINGAHKMPDASQQRSDRVGLDLLHGPVAAAVQDLERAADLLCQTARDLRSVVLHRGDPSSATAASVDTRKGSGASA